MKAIIFSLICIFISALFISTSSFAETTCEIKDCQIKITLKIAFAGATDAQIESWSNEIEDTWNGDGQVTGDCDCPVSFEVETLKITNPAQEDCDPAPAGYHCIRVTDYNNNTPVDTSGKWYVAYMYPPGIATNGESLKGWWSDIVNRPVDPNDPDQGIYHDASHEAGHMMGVDDKDGDGLMTVTWGENARPTQDNINTAVNNVCGADACPDRCCCGNGTIEEDKGESCDPFAEPDAGCDEGEYCCVECCSCYERICIADDGEYDSQAQCEENCTGINEYTACYLNYQTGCWDCVKYGKGENKKVYTESFKMKEDDHLWYFKYKSLRELVGYDFGYIPELLDLADKPINLYIEGTDGYSLITVGTVIVEFNDFLLPDPLAMIYTDKKTLEDIFNEYRTVGESLDSGRLIINLWPFEYPPEPQFVRPLDGTTVEGNVFIGVMDARGATDILETSFDVCNAAGDCVNIGTDSDGTFGWGIEWNSDTPLYPNGIYQLQATMTDFSGDEGMDMVEIEVYNEPSGVEPQVHINVAEADAGGVTEGNTIHFVVTQDAVSDSDTEVTVNLSPGTADAGDDYTDGSPYVVTILAGQTTATLTVDVPTVDDDLDEPSPEDFTAAITNATNATGVSFDPTPATGLILDNDEPPTEPTVTVDGAPVTEGDWVQFTVEITDAGEGALVTLTLTDGGGPNDPATAFIDYIPEPFFYTVNGDPELDYTGSFPVTAGNHTITVSVQTLEDSDVEPDEDFTLTAEVLNPDGTVVISSGQATIIDNPPPG